jgi:hypothetical protein
MISRTIVNDDEFEIRKTLLQDAIDSFAQIRHPIVDGHDYAHLGHQTTPNFS